MPHGFFTIEQWKPPKRGAKPAWIPILHLNAGQSLTDAINALEARDNPGFFRIIQTQRQIWAERQNGKLRLHRSHASSPESLQRTADAFIRDRGQWPAAEARAIRLRIKRERAK
jgi:hypothetical protein